MATQVNPPVQPTSVALGFWESTVGRAVRRAVLLAGAAALTVLLGDLANSQALQAAAGNGDKIALGLYWVARTLLDLLNPKISNLN
jgi:hypothetical protein